MKQLSNRILSIDVFRGITIVLMILVNTQGTLSYPLLMHADWNGCTLADMVFPLFLFIVGLTTVSRQKRAEDKTALYLKIIKRSVILFLLGLFLNIFPMSINIDNLRIMGILQRIALCYLTCSFIYLTSTIKSQFFILLGILLGYWLLMTQIPVPGFGTNQLIADGSWVAYIDQLFFSSERLYAKTYDPEGILSTIPAVATTLCGLIVGQFLLSDKGSDNQKFYWMFVTGMLLVLLGGIWGYSFPINKNLWTSSFVLWSSGFSLIIFALCFLLIDILGFEKWALPFKIFGLNAIFIFVVHVLLIKIQVAITISTKSGKVINLKNYLINYLFSDFSVANAALLYALLFLFINFLLVLYLYNRKIFIRI